MSKGTVNKVIIIGRLGKDPDLKYAPNGTAIAAFSVATNHAQKAEDGSWNELTEWHNVKSFGKQAEFVGEYLHKGTLIFLEGRIQSNSWEDQQGQKHYRTEIIASNLQLLGSKSDNQANAKGETKQELITATNNKNADEEDDDLPF